MAYQDGQIKASGTILAYMHKTDEKTSLAKYRLVQSMFFWYFQLNRIILLVFYPLMYRYLLCQVVACAAQKLTALQLSSLDLAFINIHYRWDLSA